LNTSLTEAFGIGILEAACAGLYVVSTLVGGVPEVLPRELISFANPDEDDLFRAISEAVKIIAVGTHDPWKAHRQIQSMYDWDDVARRTESVYGAVLRSEPINIWHRIASNQAVGQIAGLVYVVILSVDYLFFIVLEWMMPERLLSHP